MALDPKDQLLMRDAFYEALDKWGSKRGGSLGGAAPGGGTGALNTGATMAGKALENVGGVAKGTAAAALELTGRLAKGGVSVTDATNILGDNLKRAGGAGGTLATVLGKGVGAFGDIINYVEEGVDVFRELSKTGATFGNSVVDMRAAAAGSRLTMQEFGNIIKENNTSFLALGGSADKGAKEFAKLSKGFFDSGFGDKLTQLGYTSEDLNKLMAIQMTNMSAKELKEKGGAEAQYQSTAKLAEEMDLMAKLTGKSRKEQEETLAKAKASGQVQAAIQLEQMEGNAKAGEAFDAVATSTSGKFGELVQQMVSAGRPLTDEGRKYMGMLSQDTQKAIQEARDAYKRGDVEGAREASKRAQALESAEAATNKSRLSLAAQGVKGFEESTQEGIRYGKLLSEKAKELSSTATDPKVIEAARKALEKDAKDEQAARSGETATIIEAQNRIKDMGSAIQESMIVPLKDKINPALTGFAKTLADLNQSKAKGGTATSEKGFAGDVGKPLEEAGKAISDNITRLLKEKGPEQKFSSEAAKVSNQTQIDALKKAVEGRKFSSGEAEEIKSLSKSLKSVDGEVISKKIADIAEKSGKTQQQVIADAVNKPGGIGNLTKQISEDPTAKKTSQQAGEAAKKEQNASSATKIAEEKGRDTTGTSGDALVKGLKSGLEALGSLTTNTIELFKVEGNVNIDGVGINKRATGGFIGNPEISLIGEDGPEWVLNKEQMASTLEGAAQRGLEQVSKLLPGIENQKSSMGNLNLSEISKTISTGISSAGRSTTVSSKQDTEIENKRKLDESNKAQAELNKTANETSPNKISDKSTVSAMSFDDIFKPVRTSAQTMMETFGKENEQKKAAEQKAAEAKKDTKNEKAEEKKDTKVPQTANKVTATLDDVVTKLEQLNKNIGQLVSQHEDLGKKQLRATKATANSVQP